MQMPHYHAEEATRAIKPILGDYYMWDSREVCLCKNHVHVLHSDLVLLLRAVAMLDDVVNWMAV
jgi:hypothetical protein